MTGVNIKCRIGSTVLRIRKVTINETTNEVDETDSESGGFGECEDTGVIQADVTLEGYVRSADSNQPKVGDVLANVLVAWDGNVSTPTVSKRDLFAKLKVLGVQREGETKGGSVTYTLTCKSTGSYKPRDVA